MRFPGFKGEWEIKKLGTLMDFKVTNSFSRENLNYENGTIRNIHYGDIHTKFQTLFNITRESVPFINKGMPTGRINEDNYCQEGDMVFADASEDLNDIGKSIEIIDLNKERLLSGLHTLLARPKRGIFHLGFNGYLFKSNSVRRQIQKEAQGTKVLSINVGRISKIELGYPTIPEQQKITTILTLIDERIQTQSKIIERLESLMQGLREQLFTQKLRFKDGDGNDFPNWQVKKLGEIATKKASNISANSLAENTGVYKIYGATGILKNIDFYNEEEEYVSIVKDGAGVGRLFLCEAKTSVLGTLDVIKNTKFSNLKFLYYKLSTINFSKYTAGSTIPHIYFKDYSNENIEVPSLNEQAIIANLLFSIDGKIEAEKQILEQYERQKKYLLANLFI